MKIKNFKLKGKLFRGIRPATQYEEDRKKDLYKYVFHAQYKGEDMSTYYIRAKNLKIAKQKLEKMMR